MNRVYPEPFEATSRVPLFANLDKKHLNYLANVARRSSYRPGEIIVRKGEKGDELCLILAGQVEVRSGGKVLANLGKGDFFGEIALFDNQPRSADVVAVSPTTCFGIARPSFQRILGKEPKMVPGIMKELANRLRKANVSLTE
jgi:CRP-like cAMP-binding protein